jgi:hypothetical protein
MEPKRVFIGFVGTIFAIGGTAAGLAILRIMVLSFLERHNYSEDNRSGCNSYLLATYLMSVCLFIGGAGFWSIFNVLKTI